jgi:hypothetical protein
MPQTSDSRDFEKLVAEAGEGAKLVLAEGDSWFAYPRKYLAFGKDANVIDHLDDHDELVIYNSSSNGDEVLAMLSGDEKVSLIKRLKHNKFDYLLFSGGGNDIVGKRDFDFFIKPKLPDMTWQQCVHDDRVELVVGQIESAYRFLCELVMEHTANDAIKIFTHTYDKLIPQEEGYKLFDLIPFGRSWLYPYLCEKKITERDDQIAIVEFILSQFKVALARVAADYQIFNVVDTWGCVGTDEDEWRNEIHPKSDGFGRVADRIYAAMNA